MGCVVTGFMRSIKRGHAEKVGGLNGEGVDIQKGSGALLALGAVTQVKGKGKGKGWTSKKGAGAFLALGAVTQANLVELCEF